MIKQLLALGLLSATLAYAEPPMQPLKPGDKIPDVTVRTEDNQPVSLRKLVAEKPTVLIFYRGGWCPFCNRHLQSLVGIEDDVNKAGAQLVAIGMDTPEKLKETPDRSKLHYQLFSGSDGEAVKAFGIAFRVDDATYNKMKEVHHIDLETYSGNNYHTLPYPSVFIAGTNGIITFAHVNPDYKVRLEPAKILEALQTVRK